MEQNIPNSCSNSTKKCFADNKGTQIRNDETRTAEENYADRGILTTPRQLSSQRHFIKTADFQFTVNSRSVHSEQPRSKLSPLALARAVATNLSYHYHYEYS